MKVVADFLYGGNVAPARVAATPSGNGFRQPLNAVSPDDNPVRCQNWLQALVEP